MVQRDSRSITVEPEVETERDDAAKPTPNMVGEYLAVLSEVCQGLCGQGFPHELGVAVLFEHRGMRAPSAAAFLGERRMWDWIKNYETGIANSSERYEMSAIYRILDVCGLCMCGAKPRLDIQRYSDAMSNYGRATMTKPLACHQPYRLSNVAARWVAEGPWKARDPTRPGWKGICSLVDLWTGIWVNTSETVGMLDKRITGVYLMNRMVRFREGLTEREFLADANREQIREAIANANGTEPLRIKGDDYTSRAEWVQVFYNSLRPKPLQAWPHADPQ